jgi:CubicO group peptidase (beta-lactamase class C family)
MRRIVLAFYFLAALTLPAADKYFPPAGKWQHKTPAEAGLDAAKLQEAVAFAQANGSTWDFEKDQLRTFGRPLGPVPKSRAATNGVILRHGYVVAEFGDTKAVDPMYSCAKSFLSTVCSIAVERGLIRDVNDPVAKYIHDGGYDSPQNSRITWKNHLQQESEWEGELFGKNANFLGVEEFGNGQRKPRETQAPGAFYEYNDVRINRFSLSLLRLFGKAIPDVLKDSVMKPIGASGDWRWVPYGNSTVEIGKRQIASVSGGTRWGGGLWMSTEDMARFGLLILNRGNWRGKQLVSEAWLKEAVQPSAHGPDYGYLWWLNTQKKQWPNAPASSFAAVGNGSNIIWIDPAHDIVVVWRWHRGAGALDGVLKRVVAAVTN